MLNWFWFASISPTSRPSKLPSMNSPRKSAFRSSGLNRLEKLTRGDSIHSKESRLDVLINNAGVMNTPLAQLTSHGHDLQFGTNVFGHFYLTQLFLPLLLSTARTSPAGKARVVNVSSIGHWYNTAKDGPIRYETLVDSPERRATRTESLYFQSKSVSISRFSFSRRVGIEANPLFVFFEP